MPKYIYRCSNPNCKVQFETRHSIHDLLEHCDHCDHESTLVRVPNLIALHYKGPKEPLTSEQKSMLRKSRRTERANRPVGSVVDEYIETTKEDVKKEKERLRNEKYGS